jgi:serine protease Do
MASVASALSGGSGPVADELTVTAALLQRSTVQVRVGRMGGGSGVIWQPDGLVVTNAHVARGPRAQVELSDGRTFDAEVVAHDARRDLAALRFQATDLPAATMGDSDTLRVAQVVAAVGNPLGLTGALTLGIIHAIAPAEGRGRQSWVQADVHLAPGNSGGPLANVQGRVIGINSMVSGSLGLAVPSNAVQRFLGVDGARPRLGITLQPVFIPNAGRSAEALLILEVQPGSAADRAGITIGDVLIGAGDAILQGSDSILGVLDRASITSGMSLELLRGGRRISVHVDLEAAAVPQPAGQAA